MKYETIDAKQIEDIMKGEEPRPPADWSDKSTQSRQDNTREEERREQASAHEPEDNHTEDDRS